MGKDIVYASSQEPAREKFMSRIKAACASNDEIALPEVPLYEPKGDPVENFITKLESFDGKAVRVDSRGDALRWLATNLVTEGKQVYSAIPDFKGNFEVYDTTDPHSAHTVDICIAAGVIGVGETGSVWVTENSLGLTACALFSTDLYLLLETDKIYPGMHQAYEALDLSELCYGAFYTGPSATADIEAVHITGAQGEISLTVILIG